MTDQDILEALGGTVKVAESLHVRPQVVSNWMKRGISAGAKYKVRQLAQRRRLKIPVDFMDREPTHRQKNGAADNN